MSSAGRRADFEAIVSEMDKFAHCRWIQSARPVDRLSGTSQDVLGGPSGRAPIVGGPERNDHPPGSAGVSEEPR
jgi:hypothetical protein